MATKDDIFDFVNRGADQIFPARKIARMAGITAASQALNNAVQSTGTTKEDVNRGMSSGEKIRSLSEEVPQLWEEKINKAMMPKYAKAIQEKISFEEANRPKIKGKFDPEGMDKDYKKGGKVSSASKRGDGIAQRGKTRGKMI